MKTESFTVNSGVETQRCYFARVPGERGTKVAIKRMEALVNPGTHHFILMKQGTVRALDAEPGEEIRDGECWNGGNWSDWQVVFSPGATGTQVDLTFPPGVAYVLEGGDKIMLQIHYVNASTQKTPGNGYGIANFYTMPMSEVKDELGIVASADDTVRVCPGEMNKGFTKVCPFNTTDKPLKAFGAVTHFHSRGVKFELKKYDPVTGAGETYYVTDKWDEPPFLTGLNFDIPPGGGWQQTCTYSAPVDSCGNENAQCCFGFGNLVETQEHCNSFMYYYPRIPGQLSSLCSRE